MRPLLVVLAVMPLTACGVLKCNTPSWTTTEYVGVLGKSSADAPANLIGSDSNAVTLFLQESDDEGSLDGITMTVARRGLREFGDSLHVHYRRTGDTLLSSLGYGYYREDSLVFRTHAYRPSGTSSWRIFKVATDAGQGYFDVHSRSGRDTAGLRLVRRYHEDGGQCT